MSELNRDVEARDELPSVRRLLALSAMLILMDFCYRTADFVRQTMG